MRLLQPADLASQEHFVHNSQSYVTHMLQHSVNGCNSLEAKGRCTMCHAEVMLLQCNGCHLLSTIKVALSKRLGHLGHWQLVWSHSVCLQFRILFCIIHIIIMKCKISCGLGRTRSCCTEACCCATTMTTTNMTAREYVLDGKM